jgi:hypothetical protein
LENSLRPIERYALNLHTVIEPFYSLFYIQEQQRLASVLLEETNQTENWDIDQIEKDREDEEYRALAAGELLATNLTRRSITRLKTWYIKERSKRRQELRQRQLIGAGWSLVIDPITQIPFWYDEDTGQASYSTPKVIEQNEMIQKARENGYSYLPHSLLIHIFSYLETYPSRMIASLVCSNWRIAFHDEIFQLHVLPVESGAREMNSTKQYAPNVYVSIQEAITASKSGDTLNLMIAVSVSVREMLKRAASAPEDMVTVADSETRIVAAAADVAMFSAAENEEEMKVGGVVSAGTV